MSDNTNTQTAILQKILDTLNEGKTSPDAQQKFAYCTTDNATALETLLDTKVKGRWKRFVSVNNGIYEYILSITTDLFEMLRAEAQNTGVAAFFDYKRIPISGSISSAAVTIGNVDIYAWDGTAWQAVQVDSSKNLKVNLQTALPAGTNVLGKVDINSALPPGANTIGNVNVQNALPAGANLLGKIDVAGGTPGNITTNATTTLKTGAGTLMGITINTGGTSSTATIYDNTIGSGTKIATVNTTALNSLKFDAAFSTGLTIVTAGTVAADITLIYK